MKIQSGGNLLIKRADESDLSILSNLFDQYRQFYKQSSNPEATYQFISERLKNNESVIFLALLDNEPVGFVQLYPTFSSISMKRVWVLNDMLVVSAMRGLGVGAQLLMHVKEHAKATGAKAVVLETAPDNEVAQKLYETHGYVRDTEFLHYALTI